MPIELPQPSGPSRSSAADGAGMPGVGSAEPVAEPELGPEPVLEGEPEPELDLEPALEPEPELAPAPMREPRWGPEAPLPS